MTLFFNLLTFFLPTQLAFHFWPSWAYIFGIRIDFFSPSIYLTDILLSGLLLTSLFNHKIRSVLASVLKKKLLLLVVLFAVINISNAPREFLAAYKWLKILEGAILVIIVSQIETINFKNFHKILLLSFSWVFILATLQLINQKTVGGLWYWLGERSFTIHTPGIALFNFLGQSSLRAYATFSHPNVLGGVALVSFFLIYKFIKSTLTKLVAIFIFSFLLLTSFSQGVWLAGVVGLIVLLSPLRITKNLYFLILGIVVSASLFFFIYSPELEIYKQNLPTEISERVNLIIKGKQMWQGSPLIGVGLGNFIWYQPIHNIFLLVLVEAGIVGLVTLVVSLYLLGRRIKNKQILVCLIVILITGFLDHYWITLQQSFLMLCLLLGISFNKLIRDTSHHERNFNN